MDVLDALGSADPQHIRQLDDLAISLYYDPAINRVVAAIERFDDADRTNDILRKALKLPDDYEDVIGFPEPLRDMVSDSLNSNRPDNSSDEEDE